MIPVSILTGFLGSGKTTLLGRLLRHRKMARTAVIINEFGEIGIDHDLVETSDESIVQLTSGCLCCKVASDLAETLANLARRRAQGSLLPFERVVIETSGLADPVPILHTLMAGGLTRDYAPGSVVTTIDAVLGQATLDEHELSSRQAAMADRIVLTKLDLPGAGTEVLRARLAHLNPGAEVLANPCEAIDPEVLFGLDDVNARSKAAAPSLQGGDGRWHVRGHAHHDHAITSFCMVRSEPMRAATLALFLEALADHCGAGLLRMKGIVHVHEQPDRPAVIHGVQHIFHAPRWLPSWPSTDRSTRIVLIGRNIPRKWLGLLLDLLESEVVDESSRVAAQKASRLEADRAGT